MEKLEVEIKDIDKRRKKYALMLIWACFSTFLLAMATKNAYTAEMIVSKTFLT